MTISEMADNPVTLELTCSWEIGVCFWLDSSMRVQTSVRRSVLQPISRMRVLGQKSWISAFHCHKQVKNQSSDNILLWENHQQQVAVMAPLPSSAHRRSCRVGWCRSTRGLHQSHCSREVWRCHNTGNLDGHNNVRPAVTEVRDVESALVLQNRLTSWLAVWIWQKYGQKM